MRKSLCLVHNYRFYMRWFEMRDTRNLSHEAAKKNEITGTHVSPLTCFFISRMYRKLSIANFTIVRRLQTIRKKYVRCDTCVWVILCCLCYLMRQISCVSHPKLSRIEAVIIHEEKGFSRAIRDKI